MSELVHEHLPKDEPHEGGESTPADVQQGSLRAKEDRAGKTTSSDVLQGPLDRPQRSDDDVENAPTDASKERFQKNEPSNIGADTTLDLEQKLRQRKEASDRGGEDIAKNVRGRPFKRGDPGRPRGARNKTTRMIEQLMIEDAETIVRKTLEMAQGGNVRCIQICVDRILPRRKGRPVDIELPAIRRTRDLVPAMAAITNGVADGNLTLDEASQLMKLVDVCASVLKVSELDARVELLEAAINGFSK